LPRHPWPIWFLTGLALLGFPVVNLIYWPEVLRSGVLPSDGDSIGIPIFGSVLATLVLSPFILGLTWLGLRHYNPDTRLAAWRRDRPFSSVAITALCGKGALSVVVLVLDGLRPGLPWYEYLWPAYFGLWLPWFLALRAAAIDRLDHEWCYTER
jgi:hypothetical protein